MKITKELEFTGEFLVPNKTPYATYQEHINRYAFGSSFVKDKIVLDVASGTGYGSSYLKRKGARLVVGGDITRTCVDFAVRHYRGNGLFFVHLDGTCLPFPDKFFNAIVSYETLEHITEYKEFLVECKRVLKEDGLFICSTPNKRLYSSHTEKPSYHHHEFSVEEITYLVKGFFVDVALYGQNFINSKTMVKNFLQHIVFKIFSSLPKSVELKAFAKRTLLRASNIPKFGMEVADELLDKKYEVVPLNASSSNNCTYVILVGRKSRA